MTRPTAVARLDAHPSARSAEALAEALQSFAPVDGALLARRALLCRSDAKYLVPLDALPTLLRALAPRHGLLLAGGAPIARYDTTYFDVPGLVGYDDHVRGRTPRHKVRARHYPERGVSFLEVKSKTPSGRTEKARRPHPFGDPWLSAEEVAWALATTGWPGGALHPQARTCFRRISLVGLDADARVTVDFDLRLERPPLARSLRGLAVVEVKQPRLDPRSPAVLALRRAGARPGSFSKYAVAVALLAEGVRRNRLLPTLREIERYDPWQSSSAPIGSWTSATS
jgi:hypothetical protein